MRVRLFLFNIILPHPSAYDLLLIIIYKGAMIISQNRSTWNFEIWSCSTPRTLIENRWGENITQEINAWNFSDLEWRMRKDKNKIVDGTSLP